MSLTFIIRSRIAATAATISWSFPQFQRALPMINTRYVWQEVFRQVPSEDPNRQGQLTFEDVETVDRRITRTVRAEAPLRRRTKFVRHEKGWMRRKRLKMERRFLRLQQGVNELKTYIKYKQDHSPQN